MMRDSVVVGLFLAVLILIGVSFNNPNFFIQDLPNDPANPPFSLTGMAISQMPTWATTNDFQLKVNHYDNVVDVTVENADFVYRYGYLYTRSGKQQFELQGNLVVPSNWLIQKGTATVPLDYQN
ncbi:hypothetical protein KY311_04645 [Candidatus Woesearchaeota archaeon]|nr:hypothetical protein [Candidatus Woesearchaeota archaeon]